MKIKENPIFVLKPYGDEQEVQALREVIESGWWGKGPKVQEFEEKFAELVGAKHAISVTSNSHGNDIIMKAILIFDGILMDFAESQNAKVIIRGIRVLSDFEFEFKMALMNRSLNDDIRTLFLMPHAKYTHVSSSMVKEAASLGGTVSAYVPGHVDKALQKKYFQ